MKTQFIKLLLVCSTSFINVAYSDDSEIFFSKDLSKIKPNIVFLLDTSVSMGSDLEPYQSGWYTLYKSRLDVLKESLEKILDDPSTKGLRIGIMNFGSSTDKSQEVADVDEIDPAAEIKKVTSGDDTILNQIIINTEDDTVEHIKFGFLNDRYYYGVDDASYSLANNNINLVTLGFRFDNILIKNSSTVKNATLQDVEKATLILYGNNIRSSDKIIAYADSTDDAPFFKGDGYFLRNNAKGKIYSLCDATSIDNQAAFSCDVTKIVKDKIKQSDWQDGNAISFYVQAYSGNPTIFFSDSQALYKPILSIKMKAESPLIAINHMTYRDKLVRKVAALETDGNTAIVQAIYDAGQYISNIPKQKNTGPYHNNKWGDSPLLEGCQKTHLVLMTDGEATDDTSRTVASYMGQNSSSCKIFVKNKNDSLDTIGEGRVTNPERCGRALVSWLANISQSNFDGGNYVTTHTIAFTNGVTTNSRKFLDDLASYGGGKSYNATNASELTDTFKDIVDNASVVNALTASGQITLSPQSRYKQRNEVFYALYKSENNNYWPGNMKGYTLGYVDTVLADGSVGQRAILYDKTDTPAMEKDGTIKNTASSLWVHSIADGGAVEKGGVLEMLDDNPNSREIFTIKDNSNTEELLATANLTNKDLDITGVDQDDVRRGLLNFIHGYLYKKGGSQEVASHKIGDSARSKVTLVTYGCGDKGKNIITCDFSDLSQVALLAGNDGFLRGYDVNTGKTLYEYMPKEMLPIIQKLHASAAISDTDPRFYGLDGTVVVSHDDKNEDGFINNGEDAFVYAVSGRGGSDLYAINIKKKDDPKLAWMINNETTGFEKLGNTWSIPVTGKIKVGDKVTPILIFGGGYDISNDSIATIHKNDVGNALYIVNAKTGELVWSTTNNMDYSIPSSVAVITAQSDNSHDQLITDIFFGDMGGQLWRFQVNNGKTGDALVIPAGGDKGIIAKLANSTLSESRHFYHAPSIYKFKDEGDDEMLSVTIGSGYQAHPLSTDTMDKIFSLRFPVQADILDHQVITENDLAVSSTDGQSVDEEDKLEDNGFMINLGTVGNVAGEKVISDGFADFDRIIFNTYIPSKTKTKNCMPGSGTQRTYNFDVKTGVSLLDTPYIETSVVAFPPDVTAYCNGSYCTIIADPSQLSEDNPLAKGKDGRDSFIAKVGSGRWVKISWTDYFTL